MVRSNKAEMPLHISKCHYVLDQMEVCAHTSCRTNYPCLGLNSYHMDIYTYLRSVTGQIAKHNFPPNKQTEEKLKTEEPVLEK